MASLVREPIQVYLTQSERAELDRTASELGVSRSEVLRRGVRALTTPGYVGELRDLIDGGGVTPAAAPPGAPPPTLPVAPLAEVLRGLTSDRNER